MGHHRVGFKAADVSNLGLAGRSLQKRHDMKWTSFLVHAGQDAPPTEGGGVRVSRFPGYVGGRIGWRRRVYGDWVVGFRGRLRHTECAYYFVRGKVPRLRRVAACAGQDSPATGGRCGATRRGYGEWVVGFRGRLRHTECAYYFVRGKMPRLQGLAAYAGLSGRTCLIWRHSELTRCGGQYPSASSVCNHYGKMSNLPR